MDCGLTVEVLLDQAQRAKQKEQEIWKPPAI